MLLSRVYLIVATILCGLCCCACHGATVQYQVKINGMTSGTGVGGCFTADDITPGSLLSISVEVNVPDAPLSEGGYGGTNGYGMSIRDPQDVVDFNDAGDGTWDRTTPMSVGSFTAGSLNEPGYDVYMDSANDLDNYVYGAGPGVWTMVCSGGATWNGLDGQMIVEQAVNVQGTPVPHLVMTDDGPVASAPIEPVTVYFGVPEPASLVLLAGGGCAVLLRCRRE